MSAADFEAAAAYVQSLPKDGPIQLDDDTKLKFYAFYKQATEGNADGSQPWAVQVKARAKWDAWNAIKDMSAEEAKVAYVSLLIEVSKAKGHPWTP
ncbi:unnamed protein product [Phytomonas sp. Hart1]|nr:unnamed protein product [Phytomonas sp. Hart1]|eukprot:CCW69722.1 unnamed protein product [Phytomonas sp. isolate Hart1]